MIWLAVLFALASAATTALSTSTQHLSTGKAPDGAGVVGLMRYLVRRPEWLFALALGPVGFTFHVLALDNGPIGVVQPIAIMGIIFAVPIRAALARSWPSRSELVGVTVTALAIAVLLLAADVRSAHHSPDLFTLFVGCSAAAGGALVAIAAAGAVASPTPRAFLLGCASGVLFGLMAVLIEACQLYRDDNGLLALATSWLPYALVGAGLAGISVNQLAYRSARLSASMPVLNVVNCLLTLGFAHLVFGEVPRHTPVTVALTVAALAAIAWGLWVLCAGQRGIERFLSTADHAGAMSRLLTVVLALALLGVAAPGADAAARVRLTASDTTPVVGRPVALTADVGVRGRRVVFQKRTGQGWRAIGSDHSDRRGKATVRVRFNRVGPVTVRAVAANGADSLRLRVRKAPTVVTASFPPGPWRVGVPASTPVQVTPARSGRRVWLERREDDTWARTTAPVATDSIGAATLRWTPPAAGTETLRIRVGASATHKPGTSATVEREVRAGSGGGFLYGGGLEATQEVRDAPGHPDGIYVACVGFQPPPTGAVPTFEVALDQAQAYLAEAMAGRDSEAWDQLPARNDSALLDQVAAIAIADRRYDGALAASLRAHELDPTDGVHLSNAAAAANLVDHPEWAIAFARKAAEAGPAPSVGVRQEAARLVNLGHAFALRRQWDLAVQALRQAIAVDPESQAVQAELGAVLACQDNKAAALPHVRRSLRTDDAGDPIELQNGDDETSRRTLIDTSTVYDVSGGVDQSLILPYVPATWGELVGRSRFNGGNSYYYDEHESYSQYQLDLLYRKNALESQLSQRQQSWAPARARLVDDILRRIGTSYDREITQAWEDYLEVQEQVIGLNDCDGLFPAHPFCGDRSENQCGSSQSVFNEWERRIESWGDALSAYHDATAEHFSGLQALLKDPVAHELAGIRGELQFTTAVVSMLANLRLTSDQFSHYNDRGENDPPCVGISVPSEPDPTVDTERAATTPCSDGSPLNDLNLNIELVVLAVSIGCEGWSVEATRGVLWLEAFARVEGDWATNGIVVNVGLKAGAGGAGVETGFYYQQDGGGKVVDYGWQASGSLQAGGVVSIDLYDASTRISFMSLFAAP